MDHQSGDTGSADGPGISRRMFLAGVSGLSALGVLGAGCRLPSTRLPVLDTPHAHLPATSWLPVELRFFTPDQAAEVEAMAAQIIPGDDTPGAREAGTVYFIDRALTTFASGMQALYLQGLEDLQARTRELVPGAVRFSGLTSSQQIGVLTAIEATPFFAAVRQHTILGFFADPAYGGNQDKIGWELIGFDDAFVFDPPYGYYDRGFHGGV
jgi:gluconate 2-dehydrogenase gamma chain